MFGGNRSGKSILGVTELVMRSCMKVHPFTGEVNPSVGHYRIFCPTYKLAEENILPKLREWIPKCSLKFGHLESPTEAFDKSYDPRYHILRLANGTLIDIMSYDQDVSDAESVDLNGVWADEEMPERFFNATQARLITKAGVMWLTVTPLYNLSWAMQLLESDSKDIGSWTLDIADNPHNSPSEIQKFEAGITDPTEKEARLHGTFLEFQGLVYKELRRDVHMITPDKSLPYFHWPVVMAMDPHPRKATVITWAYVDPQGKVVFFDELEMKGTAKDIAQMIRAKESTHKARTLLRLIDPAAKGQGSNLANQTDTLREFQKEGMGFQLANNSEAGYNIVHEYLAWDQNRPLSSLNKPQVYFTSDVPKTWQGMTHLLWDEWVFSKTVRDEKEHVKDLKKDFPDCVRYTLALRPKFYNSIISKPIGNIAGRSSQKRGTSYYD